MRRSTGSAGTSFVAAVEAAGRGGRFGGARRAVFARSAGDLLRHRPGLAVHVAGVPRPHGGGRCRGEPGQSGRALDDVFVERLLRISRHENLYFQSYKCLHDLVSGLTAYVRLDDEDRPHQSLDYRTPGEVYRAGAIGERAARLVGSHPGGRPSHAPPGSYLWPVASVGGSRSKRSISSGDVARSSVRMPSRWSISCCRTRA
jgi:hypothetical protein